MSTTELAWPESGHGGGDGDSRVEVAACLSAVRVRDRKNPDGPQPALAPDARTRFLAGATA